MEGWRMLCNHISTADMSRIDVIKKMVAENIEKYKVYPESIYYEKGSLFFLEETRKVLIVYNNNPVFRELDGEKQEVNGMEVKVCGLSNENCRVLRKVFLFMNPSNINGNRISIGLGDRLGVASAGHLRLIKNRQVFPVLAQQSIRELNLTERNYNDVISAAAWAVFQEGYQKGYGADGDHLKTAEEVKMALDCEVTMITLDCSEQIDNSIELLDKEEINSRYQTIQEEERKRLEGKYLSEKFAIDQDTWIEFTKEEFQKTVLIYWKAIRHTIKIYNAIIKGYHRNIDFEISIDETIVPTSPESHFFIASELIAGGVKIASLAPRFCGEFQKGIDYIGDMKQFTVGFEMHAKIARFFGYRLSIHSGSDKFSVFPIIGKKACEGFHLKTAGTNWLEAVRVIAAVDPEFYRCVHAFALSHLEAAKKYYHVSVVASHLPDINSMKDNELPSLMDLDDVRQALHITYGFILTAKNKEGNFLFRDRIYALLYQYERQYYRALQEHIGRHLDLLGVEQEK